MTTNITSLIKVPLCPVHGCDMRFREAETFEQDYCGSWYECPQRGCACSVLIPSPEIITVCQSWEWRIDNA